MRARDRFRHGYLLCESLHRIIAFQLLELHRRVLVQELVNRKVTAADPNADPVLVDLDVDTLATELVNTLGLAHKHDLKLLAVRVIVDVLSDFLVNLVALNWDVDGDTRLQVNDIVAKNFNLLVGLLAPLFRLLQLGQQVKTLLLRAIEQLLQLQDVGGG